MKIHKTILMALILAGFSTATHAQDFTQEPLCKVQVCNKIHRVSLDLWSHIKDNMGETCTTVILPKSQAQVGYTLSDESRWYQGSSINPTKRSVTRVKQVLECQS